MKGKTTLRVQPIYTMVIWFIAFCCFVVLLFLAQIMGWEKSELDIIWYCVMGSFAAVSFVIFIYYIQFAYVDREGIVIRGLFYQIAKLRWTDIHSVVCERIVTYDNRTNVFLNWIVIKLDDSEDVHGRAGRNRRKKSPWCIIATKRNIAVIDSYFHIEKTEI